ncbi:MAG: 16S rRNA (adenine(1518)-N(6)/adenine(1519)-N(6))-dimethyltransferase RsmA [Gemmatimonadota bacterium]
MRLKKSLGQHWLTDRSYQTRIVAALDPAPGDEVVEIGPGAGALTQHLAGRVRRLVLVELDASLATGLERRFPGAGVTVVPENVLRVDLPALVERWDAAKVVGNIPYRITSPLLEKILGSRPRPARIVLTLQKEVADRLASPEGRKSYGALTVGVRAVADVEVLFTIPRAAFRPAPDVDSATVRLVPHAPPRLTPEEERDLRGLARAAFSRRRKQIGTILRDAPDYGLGIDSLRPLLADLGVSPQDRPETLAPETFVALARALRGLGRPLGG